MRLFYNIFKLANTLVSFNFDNLLPYCERPPLTIDKVHIVLHLFLEEIDSIEIDSCGGYSDVVVSTWDYYRPWDTKSIHAVFFAVLQVAAFKLIEVGRNGVG